MNVQTRPKCLRNRLILLLSPLALLWGLALSAHAHGYDEQDADDLIQEILSHPLPPEDPLPKKQNREVIECGAIYNKVAKAPCPAIDWEKKRSPHCPVELYHQKKHRDCPGHEKKHIKRRECRNATVPGQCYDGFEETKFWKSDFNGPTRTCPDGTEVFNWLCEKIFTCRLPQFGIELYKKCNSNKHPPVKWQACRHESFGVEKPKTCAIMMTNIEIIQYLAGIDMAMEPWAIALVRSSGAYYYVTEDANDLACLIKRHKAVGKYKLLIADLKALYKEKTGKVYETPSDETCAKGNDDDKEQRGGIPTPEELGCSENDTSEQCRASADYHIAKDWFEARIKYTPLLIDDLKVRSKYDERSKQKDALVKVEKKLKQAYEDAK